MKYEYKKTVAKALIELSEDIIKSLDDFSSGSKLLAHIQKVLWFYSFAKRFMSEEGVEKAEKLAQQVGRDINKARELFEVITNDMGIAILMEEGTI